MKMYIFGLIRKFALLSLTGLFVLNTGAWVQDESLSPGINERFKKQPDASIKMLDSVALHSVEQLKEILEACGLEPGMDIADVGAGSGVHVRIFAEKVLPEGKAYAVDIVPEFLDHIETASREKGIKNIIHDSVLIGHKIERLPNTSNLILPGLRGESVVLEMDKRGVCFSSGSACHSGSQAPSHALMAMGLSETLAHCSVRFSLGPFNTQGEIDIVIEKIREMIESSKKIVRFISCK